MTQWYESIRELTRTALEPPNIDLLSLYLPETGIENSLTEVWSRLIGS